MADLSLPSPVRDMVLEAFYSMSGFGYTAKAEQAIAALQSLQPAAVEASDILRALVRADEETDRPLWDATWARAKAFATGTPAAPPAGLEAAGQPDATEQMLGRYADQADAIRAVLDELAPHTTGNLQTRVRAALSAPPLQEPHCRADLTECSTCHNDIRRCVGADKMLPRTPLQEPTGWLPIETAPLLAAAVTLLEAHEAESALLERESVGRKVSDADYFTAAFRTRQAAIDFRLALAAANTTHSTSLKAKVAQVGWQPVESAPKDGTQIMLSNGVSVAEGYWLHAEPYIRERRDLDGRYIDQDESDGFDGWIDFDGGMLPEPTHWTRLPPAPGATPLQESPTSPVVQGYVKFICVDCLGCEKCRAAPGAAQGGAHGGA